MTNWIQAMKQLPEDNQMCFITNANANYICGPHPYSEKINGWLDLFATPEAGEVFPATKEYDFWWCDESKITLPSYDEGED